MTQRRQAATVATMKTGNLIRHARRAADVTVVDLARFLGVTRQQVHRYESGETPVGSDALPRIAGYLGCATADLVADAVAPPEAST